MNFGKFKKIVHNLASLGMEAVALDFNEKENATRIRASDARPSAAGEIAKASLIIFHTIDEDITDGKLVTISNIKALDARISLFDEEKTTVEMKSSVRDEDTIATMTFKAGRRKVTVRCDDSIVRKTRLAGEANSGGSRVPSQFPPLEITGEPIVLTEAQVNTVLKGISSIGMTGDKKKARVSLEHDSDGIKLSATDGKSDSYSETFELTGVADFDKMYMLPYAITILLKTLLAEAKAAASKDDEDPIKVEFNVADALPIFKLENFDVVIHTMTE